MLSTSERETFEIGEQIGRQLKRGDVVSLHGELGAGKTVLVKGIAKGIGCQDTINSPSFVYVHEHKAKIPIFHIDLYRTNGTQDILALGIHEFLDSKGICLIEWAERAQGLLPANAIDIDVRVVDRDTREITCRCLESRPQALP
jgi:tRNA threonylcarbamoyladenosine biosynthesis protein TsaE